MARSHTLSREEHSGMLGAYLGFLFMVVFMLFGLTVDAQSLPVATLNNEGVLSLPADQALADTYGFDASQFAFESEAQLFQFFDALNNDTFLIRVNPETMEGRLMLRLKNRNNWTVEQWNEALRECCEARPIRQ
jgi:hypothetical protein